jgi:CRP-like cAMP-binding protein
MTPLDSIPAFRTLSPDSLAAVARASRAVRYGAGALVRRQGTPARAVLLLLSGTVAAEHATAEGQLVWPERWIGPSIVDKPAVLDGGAWPSGLVAVTPCAGRLLPAERFLRLLEEERSVRGHVLAHLARTVLAGRRRLAQAVTLPAVARVAAFLSAHDPATPDAAGVIAWRGTQEHLGRVLGLSRVTVNRALGQLARRGAVELTPRGIVVTDRRRLHSAAADG